MLHRLTVRQLHITNKFAYLYLAISFLVVQYKKSSFATQIIILFIPYGLNDCQQFYVFFNQKIGIRTKKLFTANRYSPKIQKIYANTIKKCLPLTYICIII